MSRRIVIALSLVLLIGLMGLRQGGQEHPAIAYHLSWDKPNSHYFHIRMEIADPDGDAVDVRIMEDARELAARNPQLSASYLERRLKIGGRKAEEVMELLEEEGFFDPK